ncbi:MAG: hydroxyacid dehydrogenase [Oscillospiraceae bacterium]|nr:hydroxyacid dehydrogenase [Oscillospiraceae bacterium]
MNLLTTGAWTDAKVYIEEIERLGHRVCFLQQEADELPCKPEWVEGVICNGLFLHHPIAHFPNLRFIQLTSAGFDRVDMDYVQAHNIEIHNARGVYSIPMAEFAVCGVLQLYKQSRFFYENQKAHKWEKHRGLLELYGKTVTILGCGSVGTECAIRFKAFGCRVIGVDIAPCTNGTYETIFPLNELDTLLPATDVLVLTIPLTDDTVHLMDRHRINLLKPHAVLVNIARGGVLDEAALCDALCAKRLIGAVLDVFEEEPLPENSVLWDLESALLTPHNSFVGDHSKDRLSEIILKRLNISK